MLDFKDKTILVTGGADTGVGHGVCQAIDRCGGRLIINDISQDRAESAAQQYQNVFPLAGDIADAAEVERMFAVLESKTITLSGLVNNAGIGLSKLAHNATEAEYDRLHSIDLRGVWLMSRAFIQHILNAPRKSAGSKSASIVNISSVHAHSTTARYALYASAKAGVDGLTRGLAVELGPMNIRCNAIAPGYVHAEQDFDLIRTWTDDPQAWVHAHSVNQQALEFEIEPIDCGWVVAFLLSELARARTGQVIRIDAGMTALIYNKSFL